MPAICFYTFYIGARDTLVTFDDACPTSSGNCTVLWGSKVTRGRYEEQLQAFLKRKSHFYALWPLKKLFLGVLFNKIHR